MRISIAVAVVSVAAGCARRPASDAATAPTVELNVPSTSVEDGLTVTVRMGEATYRVGEELTIAVTLENTSDETFGLFDIDFGIPTGARFRNLDTGEDLATSRLSRIERIGHVSATLRPGETYGARSVVSPGTEYSFGQYDLLPRGRYAMTLTLLIQEPPARSAGRAPYPVEGFWSGEVECGPTYFVVESNKDGVAGRANQQMLAGFGKHMEDLGEDARLDPGDDSAEAYRVFSQSTWRRGRHRLITIQRRGERYTLSVVRTRPTHQRSDVPLTRTEWAEFEKRLRRTNFWDIAPGLRFMARDGTSVWFEGVANGRRHLVYRVSGGHMPLRACIRWLEMLADGKSPGSGSRFDLPRL